MDWSKYTDEWLGTITDVAPNWTWQEDTSVLNPWVINHPVVPVISKKYYAGIGSRETPIDIKLMMGQIAIKLENEDYILRSGNAPGADQAFAAGVLCNAEIFMPWWSFEKDFQLKKPNHKYIVITEKDKEAFESVALYHPAPDKLSPAAHKIMARNFRQIVGANGESNSEFVICWTPNGEKKGGTAQAIRIAEDFNIPVFNLAIKKDYDRIQSWLTK